MRVIVVGGVAGGASAAARLRRLDEQAEIVVYERGEHVSFANCGLPYHLGGEIEERDALLLQTPQSLGRRLALTVKTHHEVLEIRPQTRTVIVRDLLSDKVIEDRYDHLVLAPGARPVVPPIEGAKGPNVFSLRTLDDMDRILEALRAGVRRAVVVGGGFIGVEVAEALVHRGLQVSLVEAAPQVLAFLDRDVVAAAHLELRKHGVDLHLNTRVTSIAPDAVTLSSGRTLASDLVLLAIGVTPETGLAKAAGLELGPTGGIVVDEQMRTSAPHVFAVGDAVEVRHHVTGQPSLIPLAGPANRQGRVAADVIAGLPSSYRKTQGTAIVRVFDLAFGATGASAAQLVREGVEHRVSTIHAGSHAGYFPGAERMLLKVLYEPSSGRILGAQAFGRDGVDKRIDVLATAIRLGATVFDLRELELAYAPPFGSAKDPVNLLGFVATNELGGLTPTVDPREVRAAVSEGAVLVDVRSAEEHAAGSIPPSLNLPVDELRAHVDRLPKDKRVLVYCRVGQRAHVAQRLLRQHGIDAWNVRGGFTSWALLAEDGVVE